MPALVCRRLARGQAEAIGTGETRLKGPKRGGGGSQTTDQKRGKSFTGTAYEHCTSNAATYCMHTCAQYQRERIRLVSYSYSYYRLQRSAFTPVRTSWSILNPSRHVVQYYMDEIWYSADIPCFTCWDLSSSGGEVSDSDPESTTATLRVCLLCNRELHQHVPGPLYVSVMMSCLPVWYSSPA